MPRRPGWPGAASIRSPKALIVPHAGYVYSGPVAASAYARLRSARGRIRRVVLLGPSHRVGFRGLALSGADWFETPLGRIAVDHEAEAALHGLPSVQVLPRAHAEEHSLEVHLPFLQQVLDEFTLVPIVVGESTPAEVAEVLERLWGGDETLIVISSDLSHYHDYETARARDAATSRSIEALRYEDIDAGDACGRVRSAACCTTRAIMACACRRSICAIPGTRPVHATGWWVMVLGPLAENGILSAVARGALLRVAGEAIATGLRDQRWQPEPAGVRRNCVCNAPAS